MKTFLWGLLACVLAGNAMAADVPMDSLILIPKGSPPGSPANGQMWSTSAGFFGKSSGGGVVGPFGTGGGGGSGTVTSVNGTSTGGTLTPTGGPVTTSGSLNFELNLAHANTWSGQQTFVAPILGTIASGVGTNLTGLTLAGHAAQAANTVVANVTSGSAAPTAVSVPGCVDTSGNHLNYTSGTGFSCGTSSSSSGGSWNLTDGTHTITGVTTVTTPIGSLIVGGAGTNATLTPAANTRTAASPTVTTADMGGTIWISSGGLTVPVISSGLFDAKQTLLAVNYAATPSTVTNSSGQTINSTGGCSTAIPPGGFWQLQPNGTSIDCVQGGGNTPTTSGTNVTLAGSRAYYACTGTCTVTLPVPVAGAEFCIRNANNVATVITLAALGSSARYEATARTSYGSAGTGTFVSGGAVTDQVCVVGLDSTHYMTMSSTGTWTAS